MQENLLQTEIKFLKGVGPKRAALLQKELNINNIGDLIYYFPYKYVDRTKFYKICDVSSNLPYIQIKGKITSAETIGFKNKQRFVALFSDGTGEIELVWFKGIKWIKQSINPNKEYIVFGKPASFSNKINIAHPEMEEVSKFDEKINFSLQSFYNTSELLKKSFLNSKAIHNLQHNALQSVYGKLSETLPQYILDKEKLLGINEAILNIHFPKDAEHLKNAQYRLKFEELFYIQLGILKNKVDREQRVSGQVFNKIGDYVNLFYKNYIPFELTEAQKRVIKEIRKDLGAGIQMNRLLQGDVGSGKTLVALMTMLIALDNNFQACIMAPTEILANQHYDTFKDLLENLGVNVALLTGSTKKSERTILHEKLLSGELQILIGTHALIEDIVEFKNLGLVVIDEQHRFGVAQRAKLWKKNIIPPHILVMTATPIPRTLAMTIYGDLDVSIIDELPPGRKPINTVHYFDSKRLRVFGFLKKQIEEGRQIYIVYPLIKESEKMDYKDLEDGYMSITRAFPSPKYTVSILHGKMKPIEKDKSMSLFVRAQSQIMVATTVIEVGVNVPNASVMVIESAERFGLSQLHQLRGRVGRGADQSYCILMTGNKLSNEARKRIEIMTNTNNGFEISEADLKLRGPGDIEGTQQSGSPLDLKIANIARDGQIIQYVRELAIKILSRDPLLSNENNLVLKRELIRKNKSNFDWGIIS
jgi:ATP-dependent DNA helicase RecG